MKLAEPNHSRISTIFNKETRDAMANNCPRSAQLALLQQIVDDLKLRKNKYACSTWWVDELIKEYEAIIEGAR